MVDSNGIDVLPLYKAIEPYVVQAVGVVITALAAWFATQVKKWMGMTLDAAAEKTIEETAMNAATAALARLEGPISNLAIHIDSPLVASGVSYLITHAPDELTRLGFTPEQMQQLILAKLGLAQVMAHDNNQKPLSVATQMAAPLPEAHV
jgi:hypothetical protein